MTAEQYVVRIIYQTPPYAPFGMTDTIFYVSGKEVYLKSSSLINARKFDSVKNAKTAIAQRMRHCTQYFKDAKFEIVKVEVTVKEINIVTEKE